MWVAGVVQFLMLTALARVARSCSTRPSRFAPVDQHPLRFSRHRRHPLLVGWVMLCWNIFKTVRSGQPVNGVIEVHVEEPEPRLGWARTFINPPMVYSTLIVVLGITWAVGGDFLSFLSLVSLVVVVVLAVIHLEFGGMTWGQWYDKLLANSFPFTILVVLAVAIGGVVQIVPLVTVDRDKVVEDRIPGDLHAARADRPRHLRARGLLYLPFPDDPALPAELCATASTRGWARASTIIRSNGARSAPGPTSRAWAASTTTPGTTGTWKPALDLPGSNMPSYAFLLEREARIDSLPDKIRVQQLLGVPHPEMASEEVFARYFKQASAIAEDLRQPGTDIYVEPNSEIVALIAYLQQLGKSQPYPPATASARNHERAPRLRVLADALPGGRVLPLRRHLPLGRRARLAHEEDFLHHLEQLPLEGESHVSVSHVRSDQP